MTSDVTEKAPPARPGKLAEVIASRGGVAAPEAPFVIEHREALIYMLCQAAELEHGIMCQYLFAACSLKQSQAEGLTARELEAVRRWRRVISHVAAEEMLHLALVQNLLSAIGAAPHLSRPDLPVPARHFPAGVNLTLVPFVSQPAYTGPLVKALGGADISWLVGWFAAARYRACRGFRVTTTQESP
jgi:hypothetical protein